MWPEMPAGASAPMRPICVVATSVARLRIHGCVRSATRPLHWGPRDEVAGGTPGHRISRRGLRASSLRLMVVIEVERIRAAAERARKHVLRTPLVPVDGALLKLECLQHTGSFKVRGFFAAALQLPAQQLRRGLITVSAGNAAQACAYVAKTLGVSCRVVMYETAPATKIDGVKRWGATPVLMPREEMLRWMEREEWTKEPEVFIH